MVTWVVPIIGFRHKGLKEVFDTGRTAKIKKRHHEKICLILDFLNAVGDVSDCWGQFAFHPLKGDRKGDYAMSVSKNYRISFKWNGKDVYDVCYEDYH